MVVLIFCIVLSRPGHRYLWLRLSAMRFFCIVSVGIVSACMMLMLKLRLVLDLAMRRRCSRSFHSYFRLFLDSLRNLICVSSGLRLSLIELWLFVSLPGKSFMMIVIKRCFRSLDSGCSGAAVRP